jgi:hypothetical protein
LQIPLRLLFAQLTLILSKKGCNVGLLKANGGRRLIRWLAAFISSWLSLKLLQSHKSHQHQKNTAVDSTSKEEYNVQASSDAASKKRALDETKAMQLAGRTMDLTLFAIIRALDIVIGELWAQRKTRRIAKGSWTRLESAVGRLTDAWVFATSASVVMWAWMYAII